MCCHRRKNGITRHMAKRTRKPPKLPEIIRRAFTVDPYRGAAQMAVGVCPEGYAFVSMVRRGTRAVVTYRRIR